ncbi:MAG: hypothetical protein ABWY05_04705 [Noviherbaspirillum sp.]
MFEVTRRNDLADAQAILKFVDAHKEKVELEETSAHALIEYAKNNPDLPLPEDIGETSIYGYINAIRNDYPGIPTLIILKTNGSWRTSIYGHETRTCYLCLHF